MVRLFDNWWLRNRIMRYVSLLLLFLDNDLLDNFLLWCGVYIAGI